MTVFLLHHVQNTTISNSSVMYLNQAIFFTFIINFCKYETPKSKFFLGNSPISMALRTTNDSLQYSFGTLPSCDDFGDDAEPNLVMYNADQ